MFGTGVACAEKISKLNPCLRSTRREICFVQDKNAFILMTQQPAVTVLAFINLSLMIGHLRTSAAMPCSFVGAEPICGPQGQRPYYHRDRAIVKSVHNTVSGCPLYNMFAMRECSRSGPSTFQCHPP